MKTISSREFNQDVSRARRSADSGPLNPEKTINRLVARPGKLGVEVDVRVPGVVNA
jgi:hypothetical protein